MTSVVWVYTMRKDKKTNLAKQLRMAERMLRTKNHNKAIEQLKDMVSKYPNWLSPYFMLSNALHKNGETEEALEILLEATHFEPFSLVLKKHIIILYLEYGNRESARELLEEIFLLFPQDEWIKTATEKLQSPFVTETMAKLYEKQGYIDDARKIFEKLGH